MKPADPRPMRRALELLERLVAALEPRPDLTAEALPPPPPPSPEVLLVLHLGLEHLGRWIYLPGSGAIVRPGQHPVPSITAQAGRLVGIRPGSLQGTPSRGKHHRVLVVQQGSAIAELSIPVDARVDVAPRDW